MESYARGEVERRVCERVAAGWTLRRLEAEPGYPSRQTLSRWARADAGFAARLKQALAWRAARRWEHRTGPSFDPAVAERFLLEVRRGTAVRKLVRRPEWPNRAKLDRWKRERPEFAQALADSAAFSAELNRHRRGRRRFDPALADRLIVRTAAGERLADVLADPAMPSKPVLRRWRAQEREFDGALRMALGVGRRQRAQTPRGLTPRLADEIVDRILDGASLHGLSNVAGLPHHVTLYGWMRRDRAFADRVRWAEGERDLELLEQALRIVEAAGPKGLPLAARQVGDINRRIGRAAKKRRDGWAYEPDGD
jgi:hypothetical protein